LVERGITPSTARPTVAAHSSDRIQAQLEVFDWLVAQKDRKVSRNPPGFLMASIKGEYAPPKGFRQPGGKTETRGPGSRAHTDLRPTNLPSD